MAILEVGLELPAPNVTLTKEAAEGLFFYNDGAFRFAEAFWLSHDDLLPTGCGVVAQFGITEEGTRVSLQEVHAQALTLTFDGTRHKTDKYTWELTIAKHNLEREVFQLMVSPAASVVLWRAHDLQGRARQAGVSDADMLDGLIQTIVKSNWVGEKTDALRIARQRARADLSRFALEHVRAWGSQKVAEEIQKRKQRITRVGFTANSLRF